MTKKLPSLLVACGIVGLACVIALVVLFGFVPTIDDSVSQDEIVGTWVSRSEEAPGELTFFSDGTVELKNLTVFDPGSGEPFEALVSDLNADGTWYLYEYSLGVRLRDDLSLSFMVESSSFGGTRIVAIVGDPDAPEFTQVFNKVGN